MTRAAVEDGTAGLGQTHRTGRPLVGGRSFRGFSGLCTTSLAHRLLKGSGHENAGDAGFGHMLWGRTTAFDPNALGSVGPDFKLSATVDDREPLACSIATQHSVSEVSHFAE